MLTLGTNVIITTSVDLEHELIIFLWGVLVTMRVAHYAPIYLRAGLFVFVHNGLLMGSIMEGRGRGRRLGEDSLAQSTLQNETDNALLCPIF